MDDPTDRAVELLDQADVALEAGRLHEADALAAQAVELFASVEPGHPDVANAWLACARIAHARADFATALAHADTADNILVAARAEWPEEDIVVRLHGHAVAQAAAALHGLGRYDDAEARLLAMLVDVEARLGERDELVGRLCNLLGISHKYQARYDDAAKRYARAIEIAGPGGDPRTLASLYHNLGGLDHARGQPASAEPNARRSVEIRVAALGPDHPEVAADLAAWAAILDDLGRIAEAEAAYRRALAIFERTLGPAHHEVGFTLGALGAMFAGQRRWTAAEPLLEHAHAVLAALHGPDHVDVALIDHYLAVVGHGLGHLDTALAHADRALAVFSRVFPADHPRVDDARVTRDAISASKAR